MADPISAILVAIASSAAAAGTSHFLGGGNQKIPTMTKGQKKVHKNIIQQIMDLSSQRGGYNESMQMLQRYLDPNSQENAAFEKQYIDEFDQQTVPGLAERFAGAGALSSSGFGQALGSAGANLKTNLAAMKAQRVRQTIMDILNQYNQLTQTGLNAKPFGYQDTGGGIAGSAIESFLRNANFSNFSGGGGGQTQYPLTSGYDQEFRMNPAAMGY